MPFPALSHVICQRTFSRWILLLTVLMASACSQKQLDAKLTAPPVSIGTTTATSFAAYQQAVQAQLRTHRHFQTNQPEQEVTWNSPQEWRPTSPGDKGILLVHGLGDSPWSLVDIAANLRDQGFLVRTILLAGHGTKPEDLLHAELSQWQQTLAEQVAILQNEVPNVYLGGFSTGANLVTSYAIDHPDIRGLVLVSPAFKAQQSATWLLPIIKWFKPWLRAPDDGAPQQTPVRYLNTPTNGFLQFHYSSVDVQKKLKVDGFNRPALLILTQHDSVVDVETVADYFVRYFSNPQSRLIWYGASPKIANSDARILVKTDYLPNERISQFSHMGLLFSPDNDLYGRNGTLRMCRNGQLPETYAACLNAPTDTLWYSDWGLQVPNRIHARLTFNPYFEWQSNLMQSVLSTK
jgi:esterase/lipase